jgi:hypothetical protein
MPTLIKLGAFAALTSVATAFSGVATFNDFASQTKCAAPSLLHLKAMAPDTNACLLTRHQAPSAARSPAPAVPSAPQMAT